MKGFCSRFGAFLDQKWNEVVQGSGKFARNQLTKL